MTKELIGALKGVDYPAFKEALSAMGSDVADLVRVMSRAERVHNKAVPFLELEQTMSRPGLPYSIGGARVYTHRDRLFFINDEGNEFDITGSDEDVLVADLRERVARLEAAKHYTMVCEYVTEDSTKWWTIVDLEFVPVKGMLIEVAPNRLALRVEEVMPRQGRKTLLWCTVERLEGEPLGTTTEPA